MDSLHQRDIMSVAFLHKPDKSNPLTKRKQKKIDLHTLGNTAYLVQAF